MATINYRTGNYVKFLRGTPAAYEALTPKNEDTLYFVSEREADTGLLYLGDKLISGSLNGTTTLGDLNDVLLSQGLEAGSLLYFDGMRWVDKTLEDVFEIIIGEFVGAGQNTNGQSGLVPAPARGQQNMYLQGNATWSDPTAKLTPVITGLEEQLGTLIGNDPEKSARDIAADEVKKIVDNAPQAFDTLREIAEWIAEHGEEASDLEGRIASLEGLVTTPKSGLLSRTAVIEVEITSINNSLKELGEKDASLQSDIDILKQRLEALKWQDFELS